MTSDNEAASASGQENEEYDEVRDMRLAAALRKAVHDTFAKDPDYVTVRNIRTMVEDDLDLGKEWFKNDETWRSKSKEIIEAEAHIENSRAEAEREQLENEKKRKAPAKKAAPKKAAAPKKSPALKKKAEEILDSDEEEELKPVKRPRAGNTTAATKKATAKAAPKTKAKADDTESSVLSDLSEDGLDLEPPAKKPKAAPKKSTPAKPAAKENFEVQVASATSPRSPNVTKVAKKEKADPVVKLDIDSGDESEMSEVFDETPKKKGRGKAAGTAKSKKEKPAPKSKAKKASGLSPDEEKVKTLQSWLTKCGIRKLWHRELADCETPKAKQAHLRKMLADAGMETPYSQQRAKKIKEERELAAELASIQQAAPSLNGSDDDDDGDVKTRSRAPAAPAGARRSRGLATVNYFDDDDDESDST